MERGPVDSNDNDHNPSLAIHTAPTELFTVPESSFHLNIKGGGDHGRFSEDAIPPNFDPDVNKLNQSLPQTRRPGIGNPFVRKGSLFAPSSRRGTSPTRWLRPTTQPPNPPQPPNSSILPNVSSANLWDDIDDESALSIEYFRATMKRFAKPDRPEAQSCLDFSLLHFINIRHLEHKLYAELKWVNEAIDKEPEPECASGKLDDAPPQAVDSMEKRYPERLRSIQLLLHQYSQAVRDFEDMRNRPVKASYQLSFERPGEETPALKRPKGFFTKRRHNSSKSDSGTDPELAQSNLSDGQRSGSEFDRAATVMRAVNKFGRPIRLGQRRAARQMRLSHRAIAGIEDWERDFKLQSYNLKAEQEEQRKRALEEWWIMIRRFAMAVAGGIALIIPVVIMTEYPGKIESLVTTSISVILFAIFLTWYSKADEKDILAATAAYAAVLVVFVGTNLNTGTTSG
ncbi:MAG: hypothetical protein M1818_000954 [Claussenomyces sp. TS43310]|nr:MAG: hypothetical protein M1818_000954 [Claussenomyces sp. TS43310]